MKWTLIQSFFPTLTLHHLERSLYSLSRQTVKPDYLLLFDNNSKRLPSEIRKVLDIHFNVAYWQEYYCKHRNPSRTLAWGNNAAIRMCETEVFVFCRADFIYTADFCERMLAAYADDPMNYAASKMFQMNYDTKEGILVPDLEAFDWRVNPANLLQNTLNSRTVSAGEVDGPSFCTSKQAMAAGGWYDETLTGWGFDQQDLQRQMVRNGVQMKVVPEFLAFHQWHEAPRDEVAAKAHWLASPRRVGESLTADEVQQVLAEEARAK